VGEVQLRVLVCRLIKLLSLTMMRNHEAADLRSSSTDVLHCNVTTDAMLASARAQNPLAAKSSSI
jgi:hypothetical protein